MMTNPKKSQGAQKKNQVFNESTRTEKLVIFIEALIKWFKENGRDLPWRHTRDPYRILVSEIMLQQTNVDIVIPIYKKFLRKFPTIKILARSSVQEVKKITDELGYKRRGEYLLEIAKQIIEDRKGEFPSSLDELLALKGIGRYTAGAILSFAFEKPAAIVDVNVERVLARIFGLWRWEKNSMFEKEIWRLSKAMIANTKDIWTINQGILDLGAMICIAKKPKCPFCPMVEICAYYELEVEKITPLDSFFTV